MFEKYLNKKFIKNIAITVIVVAIYSTLQLAIITLYRKHGNLDYRDIRHFKAYLIFVIIAMFWTLFSWYFVNKKTQKIAVVTITTFISCNALFLLTHFLIDLISNYDNYGEVYESKILAILLNSSTITIIISFQITAFIIAYLNLTESQKTNTNLLVTQKEKENLQLKILQKNLEPHFLSNNLNILSGLAKTAPEKVDDFIDVFSEVYRYYLKYEKEKTIPLFQEIDFIEKYMELIKQRYGNTYQIKNTVSDLEGYIVPCTLQLCIENVIKHNKASEKNPLIIKIYRKDTTIVVLNKLNKPDLVKNTTLGNTYLEQQYMLNFDKEIKFKEIYASFMVEIPILEL